MEQQGQRVFTPADLPRLLEILDAPDAIVVTPGGRNNTKTTYQKRFTDGTVMVAERALETSSRKTPRLVFKNAWVKVSPAGVKSNTTPVYTPGRQWNHAFSHGQINPDSISKVVDENSEPLMAHHDIPTENDRSDRLSMSSKNVAVWKTPEMQQIEAQARANGTWLKAPNGQPTKLTERQWLHVRTAKFKQWFGDWETLTEELAFKDALKAIFEGTYDMTRPVPLGRTPDPLLVSGADNLPVTMPPSMVRKVTQDKHSLPFEVLAQVARAMKDPVFVLESTTVPDALVVILDLKHNGQNVLVAVHLNKQQQQHEVNSIASIYDKGNPQAVVGWIKAGQLRYIHQQKGRDWFRSKGLQLPKEGTPRGNARLRTEADVVNRTVNPDSVSKVVDENGEPLVVYHGTDAHFDAFDPWHTADGAFWFASNKDSILKGESGAAGKGRIVAAFLNIRKMGGFDEQDRASDSQLVAEGFDGLELDGDYKVFNSTQIKSATDNTGTYDGENPSILAKATTAVYPASSYDTAAPDPFTGFPSLITGSRLLRDQGRAISHAHAQRLRAGMPASQDSRQASPALAASRAGILSVDARQSGQSGRQSLPPVPVLTNAQFSRLQSLPIIGEGAESKVYADYARGTVYKVLQGYAPVPGVIGSPSLGIWPQVLLSADGKLDYQFAPAERPRQLAVRLAVQSALGGTPTEIVGIGPEGHVILKQPLSPAPDIGREDHFINNSGIAIARRRAGIVEIPKGILADPKTPRSFLAVVDGRPWLLMDLHPDNFVGDNQQQGRINDAVVAQLTASTIAKVPGLAQVIKAAAAQAQENGDRSDRLFMASKAVTPANSPLNPALEESSVPALHEFYLNGPDSRTQAAALLGRQDITWAAAESMAPTLSSGAIESGGSAAPAADRAGLQRQRQQLLIFAHTSPPVSVNEAGCNCLTISHFQQAENLPSLMLASVISSLRESDNLALAMKELRDEMTGRAVVGSGRLTLTTEATESTETDSLFPDLS